MKLPIVAYGMPVLRKKARDVDPQADEIRELIRDMFETMYAANGVGLAAPQVDKSYRLFVIDTSPFAEWDDLEEAEKEKLKTTRVFINARKIEESGGEWDFEEGCLSIPGINEKVRRKEKITLEYTDEKGKQHRETFDGLLARVIQHEYDHIEGILFTDYLSPLKKRMLKRKLEKISKGDIQVPYRMKFPKKK